MSLTGRYLIADPRHETVDDELDPLEKDADVLYGQLIDLKTVCKITLGRLEKLGKVKWVWNHIFNVLHPGFDSFHFTLPNFLRGPTLFYEKKPKIPTPNSEIAIAISILKFTISKKANIARK